MKIIPKDTRYIPIVQQRWCCVPACISMIMYRHSIPLIPQELLGYNLGLIVPKTEAKYCYNPRTGKKPQAGFGTQIQDKKYNLNAAFKKLGIPLKMVYCPIDELKSLADFKKYLSFIAKQDKDVMACFDWGNLYNKNYQGGHVSLIDKINLSENQIRFICSEYKFPKWQTVKISKLKKAMEIHGQDKMGGFWGIEKLKNNFYAN